MNREVSRARYRNDSRAPRHVTIDMRERCERALAGASISEAERRALDMVVVAHKIGATMSKADIDRAAGVLGRLRASNT